MMASSSSLRLLRNVFVGVACGGAGVFAGSSAQSERSLHPVLQAAEQACRSSEAKAEAMQALSQRVKSHSSQSVDQKLSAAEVAVDAAKEELRLIKAQDDSFFFRTGIAIAAVGASTGVVFLYSQSENGRENGGASLEKILASSLASVSPTLATSLTAATALAVASMWRDFDGRDLASSLRNSLASLFRSNADSTRSKENKAIEQDFRAIRELHIKAAEDVSLYRKLAQAKPLRNDQQKPILEYYERRLKEAREQCIRCGDEIHRHRAIETAIDVEAEVQDIRNNVRRLHDRDAEGPIWDFVIGAVAVLSGGGSTVSSAIAWAMSLPFAMAALSLLKRDSVAAASDMMRRTQIVDQRLKDTSADKIT